MNGATLLWRNLGRSWSRTVLTTAAMALSIFLICAVLALPSVRDEMIDRSTTGLRLVVQHDAGLTYWLPLAHAQRIRLVPQVEAVNHWTYFGGIYDRPEDFFPSFAVDPETVGAVWPDYSWDPATLERFKQLRNGALVGVQTMEKFRWKIGDEVTLRNGILNLDLTFQIVGLIPEQSLFFSSALWFPRPYLEEAARSVGGWDFITLAWVRVTGQQQVDMTMTAIDARFRNSEAETASQMEHVFIRHFLSSVDGLMWLIMLVGAIVVGAVVLIVANTLAMNVRDRVAEIAVLKTLGFQRSRIFLQLVGEGLLMASIGGGLGAGGAYFVLNAGQGSWSAFWGPLSLFSVPLSVIAQGLLLAVLIGFVASCIPARTAARLHVATALRRVV